MHTFCLQQFKTYEDAYFFNCINLKDTDINKYFAIDIYVKWCSVFWFFKIKISIQSSSLKWLIFKKTIIQRTPKDRTPLKRLHVFKMLSIFIFKYQNEEYKIKLLSIYQIWIQLLKWCSVFWCLLDYSVTNQKKNVDVFWILKIPKKSKYGLICLSAFFF